MPKTSLLTLGSAVYDDLESPFGSRTRVLGGSGVYASFAASFFTESRLISAVGRDWKPEHSGLLRSRGVNLDGLKIYENGDTACYSGTYCENMNERVDHWYHGNVMNEAYVPEVPDSYRDSPYVFLASGSPTTASALLDKIAKPKLVFADTIKFYISTMRDELTSLFKRVDGVIVNEEEATLYSGERDSFKAAEKIMELGPRYVVIKRGEYGAMLLAASGEVYLVPAYPTRSVVDPTGAGDSFAGAMTGSLAASGDLSPESLKRALLYATVVASLNVEGFSLERFQFVTRKEIDERVAEFRKALV